MFESVADSLRWLQVAFSLVCIAFGLTSRKLGNRVLAPLGVILLAGALFYFSRDSRAAIAVGVLSLGGAVFAAVWLFRLKRSFKTDSHAEVRPDRLGLASRAFAALLVADVSVVGVFWAITGQRSAAMLTLALVVISTLVMFGALNRKGERIST